MNIGIIITARVKSSRILNKPLQTISDKTLIEILIENLQITKKYPIIMAIPQSKENNILEAIATKYGIECYRGEDQSPLHRLNSCAKKYNFDYIVRITCDDIIIDPQIMLQQIEFAVRGGHDYCYVSRIIEGASGEVIKTTALNLVAERIKEPCEFVSYALKTKNFSVKEFYPPFEYQYSFRCTIDYPEDLLLMRIIYKSLPSPIGTLDIINFLRKNKYLLSINHQPKVTIYTVNYNYSKYIADTIKSIYNQSFTDFEYIIYDDCSTDRSMDVITEALTRIGQQFSKKTLILRGKTNKGLPACCNEVLSIAKGKYIVRVDSDDIIRPEFLETMVSEIESSGDDCIFSEFSYGNNDFTAFRLAKNDYEHPACCLISRRAANIIKYRDGLQFHEGKEFFVRFHKLFRSKHINNDLWIYRRHKEQKTGIKNKVESDQVLDEL